jgi:MFS transporter, SP family, general alpha glucoside:H+ symporter
VGFLGTCLSWILLVHFGRRNIYNVGLAILAVLQILIGILDCAPNWTNRPNIIWTESSLLVVWNFFYDLTIGPVCFVILCECSATRVRGKTIALATAVQALMGIVMTIAIPYMINPDQANLRGKLGKSGILLNIISVVWLTCSIGFFFGGLATLCLIWSYLRVPGKDPLKHTSLMLFLFLRHMSRMMVVSPSTKTYLSYDYIRNSSMCCSRNSTIYSSLKLGTCS